MDTYMQLAEEAGNVIDIGCTDKNIKQALDFAESIDSYKRIRVVTGWQWLDVVFNDEYLAAIKNDGLLPSLIICQDLVYDSRLFITTSRGRVRTSLLEKYHSVYSVFETRNSFYILKGTGNRKTVMAELIFNI